MKNNKNLKVSIVMGSQSDYKTMKLAEKSLKILGLNLKPKLYQLTELQRECMSMHASTVKNNIGVIIAGAGGSAHLPGMIAALTIFQF